MFHEGSQRQLLKLAFIVLGSKWEVGKQSQRVSIRMRSRLAREEGSLSSVHEQHKSSPTKQNSTQGKNAAQPTQISDVRYIVEFQS
jgi:hypothetical protein